MNQHIQMATAGNAKGVVKILGILVVTCLAFALAVSLLSASQDVVGLPSGPGGGSTDAWSRIYPGANFSSIVRLTSAGDYVLAGSSGDIRLLAAASDGSPKWYRSYGGSENDTLTDIEIAEDGGSVFIGSSASVSCCEDTDVWVVKVNQNGNIVWQKKYGTSADDRAWALEATSDGGFLIISSISGVASVHILKLDIDGNVLWQKGLYGTMPVTATDVKEMVNGDFVLAGSALTRERNGEVWLARFNSAGELIWHRAYGGSYVELAHSVSETSTGNLIVSGITMSDEFTSVVIAPWIIKVAGDGTLLWEKVIEIEGGADEESYELKTIIDTDEGNYIAAGMLRSGIAHNQGWLVGLRQNGSIFWSRTYDSGASSDLNGVLATTDGALVSAGGSQVNGSYTAWLFRLDSVGQIRGCATVGHSLATASDTNATSGTVELTSVEPQLVLTDTNIVAGTQLVESSLLCAAEPLPPGMVYLPSVMKPLPTPSPTPIPSPTPTRYPTPTPGPPLQDGYYVADLGSRGEMWFTVTGGGSRAVDGGFIARAPYGLCGWIADSYDTLVSIANGRFTFLRFDPFSQTIESRLECQSTSSTSASCGAYEFNGGGGDVCAHVSGTAVRR